jgi:hypothetical protein
MIVYPRNGTRLPWKPRMLCLAEVLLFETIFGRYLESDFH